MREVCRFISCSLTYTNTIRIKNQSLNALNKFKIFIPKYAVSVFNKAESDHYSRTRVQW
jgi:hypothetical protein